MAGPRWIGTGAVPFPPQRPILAAIQADEIRVVSIEVTWPVATGSTAVLDYADRQRDRQHGHDQVAAREHDETTLVQIRVSGNKRKQPVRGQYQDHADERIHRHRGQQQVHQRRQMRADDHRRVQGRCGRRPGQRGDES
jgi:hypothetical protein